MAQAPGHRLGQIIGETLEHAISEPLEQFANEHGLYLDSHGERPARTGKRVRWVDDLGNAHDLDHVLERGGSDLRLGVPVAFIETAWRRYTKHSRNKAQEIQGAILPLLATWAHARPFAGVVLAGVWTQGSLNQLKSNGFSLLYIPYETVISVFHEYGIEVMYDETTADEVLKKQIARWESLSPKARNALVESLRSATSEELEAFLHDLALTILRRITSISILPLYGEMVACTSVDEAISALQTYESRKAKDALSFVRFEVGIRYDNGDRITAEFDTSANAVSFLDSFR